MDVGSWQMIAGLVVGISVLVGLILYSRIHAFPALIIAAIVTGLVGGMPFSKVIASVTKGFGGTLGSIGIIIGFGIMMGAIFEKSGAAKRMARVFLNLFGKGREEIALGFFRGLPDLSPISTILPLSRTKCGLMPCSQPLDFQGKNAR